MFHSNTPTLRITYAFPRWLWLPILITSLIAWSLPLVTERHDHTWEHFRGERVDLPLSYLERIYQFNVDQPEWVSIAQAFPNYYSTDNYRINRPGYPAVLALVCRVQQGAFIAAAEFDLRGFTTTCSEYSIIFSALVVNWLLLICSTFGFYQLLRVWGTTETIASIAAAQFTLSPFISWTLITVATDFVVFPIIILTLWLCSVIIVRDIPRQTKQISPYTIEFASGLLIGLLMLVKSQYDVVLTIWLVLCSLRHFRAVLLSFVGHLVPLIGWLTVIELSGWEYFNPEVVIYRQGVWVWEELMKWPLQSQLVYLQSHLLAYLNLSLEAFGCVTLLLASFGIIYCGGGERKKQIFILLITAVLVNFGFVFAIRRYYAVYVSEIFFVIYPLAALAVASITAHVSMQCQRWLIAAYLLIATIIAWPSFWLEAFSFTDFQ